MKLAVIIPIYRSEPYLDRIILNIKKIKSEFDIELYIKDDSGGPSEAFKKIRKTVTGSITKNKKNMGECYTTNLLFKEAKKNKIDYALLLHQDDVYVSGWLSSAKKFLKKTQLKKYCILFGKYTNGILEPELSKKNTKNKFYEKPYGYSGIKYLAKDWYWQISGSIISVPLWIKTKGMNKNLKYCGDNDLAVRMLENGARPFTSDQMSVLKENTNNSSSRVFKSADAAIGWSYLMVKHQKYRTKKETAKELFKCLRTYFSKTYLLKNSLKTSFKSSVILFRTFLFNLFRCKSILSPNVQSILSDY